MKNTGKSLTREEFALGLKMHRDRLKITQAQAAELCEVSLRVWADWERATGSPPLYPTRLGVLQILGNAKLK